MGISECDTTSQPVFIIGAPRSGTTWLQLLLSQHPAVATCNETHLFDSFLASPLRAWIRQKEGARRFGLHTVLTENEFYGEVHCVVDHVLKRVLENKSGAEMVLEKTPAHVRHWQTIHHFLPTARFIHLVRDPRSVVASLRRAGRGWGHRWAAPGIVANAERWSRDVSDGLAAEAELEGLCRRVCYERLREDTATQLMELFEWIGLAVDSDDVQEFVARCELDNLREGRTDAGTGSWETRSEPAGFFGTGARGGAESGLSRAECRTVEWIADEAMQAFDYAPVVRRFVLPPPRVTVARLLNSIEWRCRRWQGWV